MTVMAVQSQSGQTTRWVKRMMIPRMLFSWYLLIVAALFLGLLVRVCFVEMIQTRSRVVEGMLLFILVIVFGLGFWVGWRESGSEHVKGRTWIMLAGVLSLCLSLGIPVIIRFVSGWGFWYMQMVFGLPTVLGALGLIAFSDSGGNTAIYADHLIDCVVRKNR